MKLLHVVTPAEEKEAARQWGRKPPKWDYVPEGRLSFRLEHMHHLFRGRAHWTDTKATPLEQRLGRVVVGIELAARAQTALRAEEARRKAEALAQERKRLRGERIQWYQTWMAQELEASASEWARAQELRQFLAAYEAARGPIGEAMHWLEAARHYADRLDPLTSGRAVHRELEPSDEVLEQLIADEKERARRSPPTRTCGV